MDNWIGEIPGANGWTNIREIISGWSGERKYRVETKDGPCLLRVTDGTKYDRVRATHDALQPVNALGLNVSRAIACGRTADGSRAWSLLSYIEGDPLEEKLPLLSEARQYELGLEAGRILAKLHTLKAPEGRPDWETFFNEKIERKRANWRESGLHMQGEQRLFQWIDALRPLLKDRPQSFQHGDYHVGNMTISDTSGLGVIDFNRQDYGDPWEEFNRIVWCAGASKAFARGRVDGYFGESGVPDTFFPLLALYIANNVISSVPWALRFGESETKIAVCQYEDLFRQYDDLRATIPAWYRE